MSSSKPMVYLSRTETFSSAHRLNRRRMDGQTNSQLYGKCNSLHGHNFKVEVTIKGTVDPTNGTLLEADILKNIIYETVMKTLDHKYIDEDVDYFRDNDIVSSLENISVYIWKMISERLPENVCLDSIKLHPTDKNVVVFRGQYV